MNNLRVVSGGQTGIDLAGVTAACVLGIPTGGWAPKGWVTTHGQKHGTMTQFGLKECEVPGYAERTKRNVRDSHFTLILFEDYNSPGERCTRRYIESLQRPHYEFNMTLPQEQEHFIGLAAKTINACRQSPCYVINIAGNSEVTCPGIFIRALPILGKIFSKLV